MAMSTDIKRLLPFHHGYLVMSKVRGAMRSKTMWFSLLLAVFGAIEATTSYLSNNIDPKFFGIFVVVVGVITAVLRVLTTIPLEDR